MRLLAAAVALLMCATTGALAEGKKITISGSDTMNMLTQRLAEQYMKTHPDVQISVKGGGSSVGIRDLMEGLNDIAQASRKMKPEEIEKAKGNGYDPQEHVVALDGIAIAVNAGNPVESLTINQVKAIYSGTIKTWSDLDPKLPKTPIALISREANCGTYDFFKEHVLGKEGTFASNTSYLSATAAIADSVGKNPNAIGFGGVAYFAHPTNIRVVPIKADKNSAAVSPIDPAKHHVNLQVIQDGSYPISRPLQYYTPETATGDVESFLTWAKSTEGQKIVLEQDYIPLESKTTTTAGK